MSSTGVDRIDQMLQAGIRAAQGGDAASAQRLLQQVTDLQPANAQAWMWLAYVAHSVEDKRAAITRALALRPGDARLRQSFQALLSPQQVQRAARSGVFVSYARPDEVFAITLTESLRAAGVDVWLDMTDVSEDTSWHSSVIKALRRSGLMLVILSPAAVESEDLRVEREWFQQHGKIILPVLYRDYDSSSLQFYLPPVDFREDYEQAARHLCAILGAASPA